MEIIKSLQFMTVTIGAFVIFILAALLIAILLQIFKKDKAEIAPPKQIHQVTTSDELERTLQMMRQNNVISQSEYNHLLVKSLPYSR